MGLIYFFLVMIVLTLGYIADRLRGIENYFKKGIK